ncbi:DUF2285 domain-containing protein (plasmid) [Phyllobacteriaceae bacterium JZ32]
MLWTPSADPGLLLFTRLPDGLPIAEGQPGQGIIEGRDSPEGRYAFHDVLSMQLLFLPGALPGDPLTALVPLDADTLGRIEALSRFWRASQGRPVPRDTRITANQRRRLRLKLQAADGRMNGASYREIAFAIFGKARVASDPWKTSPLRDTIIGLVEEGLALIAGGYRQLLRHRRRS